MDPRKVQAAIESFMHAMQALDVEYIKLMQRCGCKRIMLHRF